MGTGQWRPECRNGALFLLGAFLPVLGIVVEGAVDHGIRLNRSVSQAFQIGEIALMHLGTGRSKRVCAGFRPCKSEHPVPSMKEFRNNR